MVQWSTIQEQSISKMASAHTPSWDHSAAKSTISPTTAPWRRASPRPGHRNPPWRNDNESPPPGHVDHRCGGAIGLGEQFRAIHAWPRGRANGTVRRLPFREQLCSVDGVWIGVMASD